MSVRKIRSDAQFVDLGRPEESPLDKLNKLVSGVGNIMSGVSAIREKRSTEQINSIQMLNNVIDRADDLEDLKNIQNRISSLPYNYHNDAVNIASEALQLKYKQADEDFEYMQGLGNEIADFVTKPLSFTDSKGNNIEKTFSELSVEEIMDYSKSYAGTNELKSGLLGNITENMNKINQLEDAFTRQFGEKRKNPRFKFKNHLGADVNISEFATISKRYADQMEIFIDAGLGPSDYLNYEEAQLVKNGDVAGYEEKKKQRETEFASYIPRVRKEIDNIGKMILDLRGVGDDDELSAEFIASLGNVLKLTDAKGNPFAAELALQQNGVNAPLDVNNMYEDIVGDFTKMSTNGIVDYLGKVKKELEDEEDLNVKAAISWGFGARFGYANVEPDEDALKALIEKSKVVKKEEKKRKKEEKKKKKEDDTPIYFVKQSQRGQELIKTKKQLQGSPVSAEQKEKIIDLSKPFASLPSRNKKEIFYKDLTELDKIEASIRMGKDGLLAKAGVSRGKNPEEVFNSLTLEQKSKYLNQNLKKGYSPTYKK